jgi:hypothetical protein
MPVFITATVKPPFNTILRVWEVFSISYRFQFNIPTVTEQYELPVLFPSVFSTISLKHSTYILPMVRVKGKFVPVLN